MNPIENELKILLNDLDLVGKDFEEVGDTDVREQMSETIYHRFLKPSNSYNIPDEFGMFSYEGNKQVKAALIRFLSAVESKIGVPGLETPEERLKAFQDEDIESDDGMFYDDYFGYAEGI
jgi:hypothetical protein